jgi:hypothetical protein
VRDLQQPRELGVGTDAALERAVRVEERGLHRILCLLARPEPAEAESEDLARMGLEERARLVGALGRRAFETRGSTYGFGGGDAAPPAV